MLLLRVKSSRRSGHELFKGMRVIKEERSQKRPERGDKNVYCCCIFSFFSFLQNRMRAGTVEGPKTDNDAYDDRSACSLPVMCFSRLPFCP